jgi:hypothetical protein
MKKGRGKVGKTGKGDTKKLFSIAERKEVGSVVCISDTHIGCGLALMHPDGAERDEGNVVKPSKLQIKLWSLWEEFWGDWVPRVTKGEPYYVLHNGDATDGVHHNSTTQWSHNILDQHRHAVKILKPVVELCEGRYFHIRGTSSHTGESGVNEESLARELGSIPSPTDGHHARWELQKTMGQEKYLISATHHIGTTSSAAHETSAVNAELAACFTEAGRWGHKPPNVIVRSHRHRCSEIRLPAKEGYYTAFVTPAWQLRTPYCFRVAGARNSASQIGGSLIKVGDEDGIYTRHFCVDVGRPISE